MDRANVAATLHAHLCEHSWHGYTQGSGRWGDGEGYCDVEVDGSIFHVAQGDRDCSSSVVDVWQQALKGSAYEGVLGEGGYDKNGVWRSWYTGNMRNLFVNSGLFEWKPMSFTAQRGDIYLNEVNHTALCQSPSPDMLSEFLSNEHGTITGGTVGDQTGGESVIRGYYDFPWNGILHYNGKADGGSQEPSHDSDFGDIYICAETNKGVLPEVKNNEDDAGDGSSVLWFTAYTTKGTLEVEAHTKNGWLGKLTNPKDMKDRINGCVGDGTPIDGLSMYWNSPSGKNCVYYRVMVDGSWLPWMRDRIDTGGSSDTYAGIFGKPIQRVEAYLK